MTLCALNIYSLYLSTIPHESWKYIFGKGDLFIYFGHLMQIANSLEKIEGKRRRGQHRMRWLDSITDSVGMYLGKFWEVVRDREAWCAAVYWVTKSQSQL